MFGALGRRENQEPGGWSLLLQPHLSLCSSTSTQTTAKQRGSILHQQPKTSPRVLLLQSQDKSLLNPIPTNTSAVPSCQPLLPVMILEGWKAASSTTFIPERSCGQPSANLNQNWYPFSTNWNVLQIKHIHTQHTQIKPRYLLWVTLMFHTKIHNSQ